jgi:FKBP-type peptidyl-prolyl cis-trans isomerase FkpA
MKKYIFVIPLLVTVIALSGCVREAAYDATKSEGGKVSGYSTTDAPVASDSGELIKEDLVVGTGTEAVSGKAVSVHYTGTLTNGTKFDSSKDRNEPFNFTLGAGQVIKGWDAGVAGMKVGGKRKLTIPASMGYGARDMGVIPPNSTLVFEVELLDVK